MIADRHGVDPALIDRLYEAAILTGNLPAVMQEVADRIGAAGAALMSRTPTAVDTIASPRIEQAARDYVDAGWALQADHAGALFAEMHPGFRAEADYNTPEAIAAMPVHAEFLDPRGLIAGAATVLQGAADHLIHFSIEGFPSHEAAVRAVPALDALRPDLARALTLAALRRRQSQVVVDSLALAGVGAAIVGAEGRLRAANDAFTSRLRNVMHDARYGLRFADGFVQEQFAAAVARYRGEHRRVQSIAIRGGKGEAPFALHLMPITGAARDLCESDGMLLLVADPANRSLPEPDLLRMLFDLTPSEARLVRALTEGLSIGQAAARFNIAQATARVQLRSVFAKTGTSRQGELTLLLAGVAPPPVSI